jgi:DNA-binding transcriptional regulator GbsR (MarR family)
MAFESFSERDLERELQRYEYALQGLQDRNEKAEKQRQLEAEIADMKLALERLRGK